MTKTTQFQPLISPLISWEKNNKASHFYGECIMEPLEPGFGVTFGNVLRRILLGGVEGSAVTSVIIKGINNEFSVIPGVIEDVMSILLNIKMMVIKNSSGQSGEITILMNKPGQLLAGDCQCSENLSIINKDLLLANIAENGELEMTLFVESGRGYLPAQWPHNKKLQPDNRIFIDAMFAPVINVSLETQKTRVGSNIDYDKLILGITTNGTMTPAEALNYAISVALHQFNSFLLNAQPIPFDTRDNNIRSHNGDSELSSVPGSLKDSFKDIDTLIKKLGVDDEFFFKSIDTLSLSARVHNSLLASGVSRIIDLVNSSEQEIVGIKNLGKKSFEDLVQNMKDYQLSFGMAIDETVLLNYMEKKNVTSKQG